MLIVVVSLYVLVHLAGLASAIYLLMRGDHRSRGAVAWVIALIGVPWLALPLYWTSGHVRFTTYQACRKRVHDELECVLEQLNEKFTNTIVSSSLNCTPGELRWLTQVGTLPTTGANEMILYDSGIEAFDSIVSAIGDARQYVLLESYLIRSDTVGTKIQAACIEASDRGCAVFILYDELGSADLPDQYITDLRNAGVHVSAFSVGRRILSKLRTNFRNHRKIVIVDGETAFVGGLNIGDEYRDGGEAFDSWRDTHLRIDGPAALALQLCFIEDWYFANDGFGAMDSNRLSWHPVQRGNRAVTICGFGPHLDVGSGDQLFTMLIESAQSRLWIASPYFVPDDRVLSSLQVAALRGVDIQVLVPRQTDHRIFEKVHRVYARELNPYAIQMHYYEPGFMHQKTVVVDEKFAVVGSANFDNRSFRLNFEVAAVVQDEFVIKSLADQLAEDFTHSSLIDAHEFTGWEKLVAHSTRALSPLL